MIVTFDSMPWREAQRLRLNQRKYKPHQIEMAKNMVGLIWVEAPTNVKRCQTSAWRKLRKEIFARDNYTCGYCGRRGGNLECDHIVPATRGGADDPANLITACRPCNRQKSDMLPEEWQQ